MRPFPVARAEQRTLREPLGEAERVGFDIATGLFGDPALGAVGNTAQGPGSQAIRNALTARAQPGFDASAALHLPRHYGP